MSLPIKSNNKTYLFYLDDPNFEWDEMTPPPILSPKPSNISPTPTETSSPDKIVIVSVSVGLVAVILTICVVFYRYIKGRS